ncbi:MAG: UvrD-helicase domain-containing protein [Lentimicrobiaceae bacterium]|jgi:ATP-dependent exoDNAse (exonuclease V) beta subunit|nr:UvrD-helicase domain-containing protein [Lentimicrobiaceae bacterium]
MGNFKVYKASAGSGKTFSLVKAYLKLALQKPMYFTHILAVTFTNKAANEMKSEILNELHALAYSDSSKMIDVLLQETNFSKTELQQRAEKVFHTLIHNYSDFNISTIDSFVQRLSRTFARDLNLPSQYQVLIDEKDLLQMSIEKLFEKIGIDNFVTDVLVNYVTHRLENEEDWQVEQQLKKMLKNLLDEEVFHLSESTHLVDELAFRETKKHLTEGIKTFENELKTLATSFEKAMQANGLTVDDMPNKSKGIYLFIQRVKTMNMKSLFELSTLEKYRSGDWIPKKPNANLLSAFDELQSIVTAIFDYLNENYTNYSLYKQLQTEIYTHSLQSVFFDIMNTIIVEQNLVHVSEFNKRISKALYDSSIPYIFERLGERYSNLMIDEFQDTSILQWHNFLPLFENSLANGNISMIVGDGKQSIYRFRSGEAEQFQRLPEIFAKELNSNIFDAEILLKQEYDEVALDTNYRTHKEIVDFNNDFFNEQKATISDMFRSVYDGHEQRTVERKSNGLVQLDFVEPIEGKKVTDKDFIDRIVPLVQQLKADGYAYRDMAVLVNANKKGNLVVQALNKHRIPVVSVDSLYLGNSPKVQLLVHALAYFYEPENPIVLTQLTYFHFVVKSILQQTNISDNEIFEQLKSLLDKKSSLKDVLQLESDIFDLSAISTFNIYDMSESLIRAFGLEKESDPYVLFFLDKVHAWQSSNTKGLSDFLTYWNESGCKESVVVPELTDAVKVMTVHKAKGLGFPIVIYPFANAELGCGAGSKLTKNHSWIDISNYKIPHLQTVMLPVLKSWMDGTKFLPYYETEKEKTYLDNLNVLYVAMTRPKKQLYVMIDDAKKGIFGTYLQTKGVFEENKKTYIFGTYEKSSEPAAIETQQQQPKFVSSDWMKNITIIPDVNKIWNQSTHFIAVEWGNLVHAILAEINTLEDAELVLIKHVFEGTIDKQQSDKLLKQIHEIANHPLLYEAFSENVVVRNEAELLTTEKEVLRPDRFSELPNKIMLIDYKTGTKKTSDTTQLLKYKTIIQAMFEKPIEAYLVYLNDEIEVVSI